MRFLHNRRILVPGVAVLIVVAAALAIPLSDQQDPVEAPAVPAAESTGSAIGQIENIADDLKLVHRNVPQVPRRLEKVVSVASVGGWKPVLSGPLPPGWRVAADTQRELRIEAESATLIVPIYRLVPEGRSIYLMEPLHRQNRTVDSIVAALIADCDEVAGLIEATAAGLERLIAADGDGQHSPHETLDVPAYPIPIVDGDTDLARREVEETPGIVEVDLPGE